MITNTLHNRDMHTGHELADERKPIELDGETRDEPITQDLPALVCNDPASTLGNSYLAQ